MSKLEENYGWSDYEEELEEEEGDMEPEVLDFQVQLRQIRQARDAKQALNGKQPIFLFFSNINLSHLFYIVTPSHNFFLLLLLTRD